MRGCVLTPAPGRFSPNRNSEAYISRGILDYTTINTVCHTAWIVFEYQYLLYNKGKRGTDFKKGVKR
jgi:hypothetical protein